jgi:hypothetical protein
LARLAAGGGIGDDGIGERGFASRLGWFPVSFKAHLEHPTRRQPKVKMYHIVGSDNQPRGPIDAATLNQWIAEGRANGQTMTCVEGSQEWKPLAYFSEFAPALTGLASPPPSGYPGAAPPHLGQGSGEGDATGGLIPYKNKQALIGYYMAFAGGLIMFIPVLGIFFSIGTLIMGIKGLKNVKENPVVRGTAHAWIAVIGGGLEIIFSIVFTIFVVIGIIDSQ